MTVTFGVISHFTKTYVHCLYLQGKEIAIDTCIFTGACTEITLGQASTLRRIEYYLGRPTPI